MRIVIAGSSGLIGTALRASYERDGHAVVRLVRRPPRTAEEVFWDARAEAGPNPLEGADILVNLAGAGLGDRRWTRRYREVLRHSRTGTAAALARMAAQADRPPAMMLSASGIRIYGIDRRDEFLTEDSAPDTAGLLPAIAADWEAATAPATEAGIPVCHLRLGLVLSRHGGLFPPLVRLFRFGMGAYFATGSEFWSYVSLTDTVRAIRFLATHPDAAGPYNISAPDPVRNRQLIRVLARALGRPTVLRLPQWTLRVALGGIASEVFGSLRVLPARLSEAGFEFAQPDAVSAVREALR